MRKWLVGLILGIMLATCATGLAIAGAEMSPLETSTVGAMTGSTGEFFWMREYPDSDIKKYDNIADAIMALQAGKLDYVITTYTTALNYERNNDDLYIYKDNVEHETVAIAVGKENAELTARIDEILTEFKQDGTMEEILSHWIHAEDVYGEKNVPPVTGNQILMVGIAANREPMCFVQDNEISGLDCELIERIAAEMGMTVQYQDMQFSALVAALQSGKVDVVISNMTPTDERKEKVDFSQDYFENPQVLLARKTTKTTEKKLQYTDTSQLKGKKIGIMTGSYFDQMLESWVPGAISEYFNTFPDMVEALKSNRIDGFLVEEPIARTIVQENPEVAPIPQLISIEEHAMMLSKDKQELADEISQVIRDFWEDGTRQEIDDIWFGEDESKKVLPDIALTGERGTLKVSVSSTVTPFCYIKDGQVVGYDIDMLMRICERLGYRMEIEDTAFGSMITAVVSGKYDIGTSCITVTPERQEAAIFTEANYRGGMSMVVRVVEGTEEDTEKLSFLDSWKDSFTKTFIREDRWKLIVSGLGVTFLLSIASAIAGSMLGFGICMMRRSDKKIINIPAKVYIRIIQGTPLVVLLMILYYVVFTGRLGVGSIPVAIIGFSINFAAYVSEMIRTGINAVDKGQIEAAQAMGFNRIQTFMKITFPQAARHFLPVFKGEFISMVKMTSIVGYIAIQDLTKVSDIIRSRTYDAFFPLIVTAIIYFLLSWGLTGVLTYAERRIDPKRRNREIKEVRQV